MKNALVATTLIALLLLTGCTQERDVQNIVRKALKDPDSAQFPGATNVLGEGTDRLACGLVNAKNGFGGYTGAHAYMLYRNKLYMPSNSTQSEAISNCCSAVHHAMLVSGSLGAMPADNCRSLPEPMAVINGIPY